MVKKFGFWNADDADLLWQNADGDGFAKAKVDKDGFCTFCFKFQVSSFFGTRIREI
ncbi:hypothetical protein [Flavobacterium cucumis]|uniref:hypothetical protein n=1 Tax=Flavobacterium cucumis TaxID=416016 RepID=UPI0013564D1B|nr:hypothetical protein [Flavobacterium cucumis]